MLEFDHTTLSKKKKEYKTESDVVHIMLSDVLNAQLNQFTAFFGSQFTNFESLSNVQRARRKTDCSTRRSPLSTPTKGPSITIKESARTRRRPHSLA